MFPQYDLVNHTTLLSGNVTETVVLGSLGYDLHIIAIAMQQEKDLSETEVTCGGTLVAKNYAKDFPQVFYDIHCDSQDLEIIKTGQDEAYVSILYATSSQHTNPPISIYVTNQLNNSESLFIGSLLLFFLGILVLRSFTRLVRK